MSDITVEQLAFNRGRNGRNGHYCPDCLTEGRYTKIRYTSTRCRRCNYIHLGKTYRQRRNPP